MSPRTDEEAAVREIYLLLHLAAARRQPVAAVYDGLYRLLCPHVLDRKSGRLHVFAYQFGGRSNRGLPVAPKRVGVWRCLAVENCTKSNLRRVDGIPNHDPADKPALMKSISTPTLSVERIRNKGNKAVAGLTGAPG